jgi:hypothetical protein
MLLEEKGMVDSFPALYTDRDQSKTDLKARNESKSMRLKFTDYVRLSKKIKRK